MLMKLYFVACVVGVIPRVMAELFARVEERRAAGVHVLLKVGFVEIHKVQCSNPPSRLSSTVGQLFVLPAALLLSLSVCVPLSHDEADHASARGGSSRTECGRHSGLLGTAGVCSHALLGVPRHSARPGRALG
jgi:hypothetical protein